MSVLTTFRDHCRHMAGWQAPTRPRGMSVTCYRNHELEVLTVPEPMDAGLWEDDGAGKGAEDHRTGPRSDDGPENGLGYHRDDRTAHSGDYAKGEK